MQNHDSILETIFANAVRMENEAERASYIQIACGDDSSKLAELQRMLRDHSAAGAMFDRPAAIAPTVAAESTSYISRQIGPYKLRELLGEGGMGSVYVAEQDKPVRRKVALKIIKPGMGSREVISRFESERQALALMDHPHIARVLDAGTTDSGLPYFVMELVKGLPITEHCDAQKLTTRDRLELFLQVCQAVQHAHQKGIIHRDIKPSNVIVAIHDVRPVVKVIDFGVAKAIGQQLTDNTLYTAFSQMVGTPLYMSPEQAGQSSIDIDTRSDIYSLGVLLYEILTGHTPFKSETMRNAGFDEMRRMIREVDPPRPSLRVSTLDAKALSTISDNRNVDARKLSHQLRGELDWIVMMALEKDRNRRYDTANEFADDVQHFLNDEAVHACPPSAIYRFRKLASRNRASLSAATLVASALIIGTTVATWQAMRARDSQAQTEIARKQLDQRYRIAKEAVDTYLLRITQDERLDHPSFRQLRQSLLEAALPYYDQLHEISPTDEQSRAARAETLNQLGNVKRDLGRFDESLASFEESAKLFDQLAANNATKIAYRQSLAKVLVNLADHYRIRGANSESLEYEQHALTLRQQLATEHPDNDLLQLELAQSYTNVGVGTQEIDGREMLERAIEIWQELTDRFPDQLLYREYLSLGYQNLANRFAWDQAEEAIPFHELAINLLERLAKEQPESKKAHIQWAQSHQSLADTLEKLSPRLSDAREYYKESIRILKDYSKRHPELPEVKSRLANALNKLAHILKELDDLVMAHETCDSSLRLWEQLQSEYPDMLEYEVGMAAAQQNLGAIVVAKGQATDGLSMLTQSRDRLQKMLDQIGPHERSNELMRTITSTLADTRKVLGHGRERSSVDEIPERKTQTVGEALRPSKFLKDLSNSPTHGLRVGGVDSSLMQTQEPEQSIKRLRKQLPWSASRPQIRNERPLQIEQLEGRQLLAVLISVSDTSISELGSPSAFVTAGSGGLDAAMGITIGPDGNVYVAGNNGAVRRYNGDTAQYINTFVTQGSGGLSDVYGLTFGPDGDLYVASGETDEVLQYNGATGAFIKAFVPAASGGLDYPRGITFGADGNLYVSSYNTNSILRYRGPMMASPGTPLPASGQPGAEFVARSSGGLYQPLNLSFGPDGNLYVDGGKLSGILRFDGTTGVFVDTFVPNSMGGLAAGRGMAFDQEGWLYVADSYNNVHRYDSHGNSLGDLLVNPVSLELSTPNGLAFSSRGDLLISSNNFDKIVRYDRGISVALSEASSTIVTVDYATLDNNALASKDYFAQSGKVTFKPGETTRRILLATRDDLESEPTETFMVQLRNPVGATMSGTGICTVTVSDEDITRQVSIADASAKEGDNTAHFRGSFVQGIPGIGFTPLAFGPDGNLYTGYGLSSMTIDRYDGTTGAFMNRVVQEGRLKAARDIVFSNGYLYVGSEDTNEVLRYNASTGAFVDAFVSAGSGGIAAPHGLTFGPDSNGDNIPELYVSGRNSFNVVRYDGATGNPLGSTYVGVGSGGLAWPQGLMFDSTGSYLYVVSTGTNQVLKYNALTGAYVAVAASAGLSDPRSVKFGPDGLMYVVSAGNNRILRYTATGVYVDDYVSAGSGGMTSPMRMAFGPDGNLYVTQYNGQTGNGHIMRFGTESETVFTVSLTTPSTLPIQVTVTTADLVPGSAFAGSDYATTSDTITFAPGYTTATIRVPILDDATTEQTETFVVNIGMSPLNPGAGTVADSQAVGTILDNDPFTKFYVVNDASTDRVYEYGDTGASVENYALAGGNTAPRGAASTTMGTTVWVIDANKSVYVYDTSGTLQGSWAAGGLQSTAQLEGIATNGTDVWLVDNKADKVYRYTNAATLTNGSPIATSSFSLNSDNTSPKDIVTDGNYLWVINDSGSDKVFKYTIGGTYVGSWTISTSGATSPTGITLDPSNPAHIWIVDSGTKTVYQYDNAVGLSSGSKSANSNWALAAGNTNPQGIADPPPPSFSTVGKSSDLQSPKVGPVPMPVFSGQPSMVVPVTLLQVQSKVRSTDDFKSFLGHASEQPKATVSNSRTPVIFDKTIDLGELIDGKIKDNEIKSLSGLVANDLWN